MNIVLIGYRCSGKTATGKIIAEKMERLFMDTDVMIEQKAGCSIEDIIAGKGWEYFRTIEKDVIKEISDMDNLVIATGGGVVTDVENVRNLKKKGLIVWLKADSDILKERMVKDKEAGMKRPSLMGNDPLDEIGSVLELRNPLYENAGDLVIETDSVSEIEAAESIIREASGRLHRLRS